MLTDSQGSFFFLLLGKNLDSTGTVLAPGDYSTTYSNEFSFTSSLYVEELYCIISEGFQSKTVAAAVLLFVPTESWELPLSPCDLLSSRTQGVSFANCQVCNSSLRIYYKMLLVSFHSLIIWTQIFSLDCKNDGRIKYCKTGPIQRGWTKTYFAF